MPGRTALVALAIAWTSIAAGCSRPAEPSPAATAPVAAAPTTDRATAVTRQLPRPTPTVDAIADPMAPVTPGELPGVVVPAGAVLVKFQPATEEADARADFRMAGADNKALSAWFLAEMPKAGWGEGEAEEGSVQFQHTTQLSKRHASEGLKRSALVLFDLEEGVDFSVLAEAAAP